MKAPSSHPAPVSLAEIQQEEEQARLKVKQTPVSPPPNPDMSVQLKSLLGVKSMPAKSGGSPWNTTEQATLAAQAASLRDIMQEEESSVQQKKELTKGNPASSWATKAKSTTGSGPVVPVAMEQPRAQFTESKPKPVQESVVPSVALHSAGHRSTPPQPLQGKSEFGGRQMSKEMADWCGAQLKRITGSDDLTLMHFCMSLSSATEIRETLASYLGSSPQVGRSSMTGGVVSI